MPTLDDVYRKFGEVSEAAQLLETELGTVLLQIRAGELDLFSGDKPEEAAQILTKINNSTLGQVLKRLPTADGPPNDTAELFAAALAERNRLAHGFYRHHNFRRNSDQGRALMLSDLESIHGTLHEAYRAALALSGIDLDSVVAALPTKHLPI